MSLVKSPTMTSAKLAANRSNALKSTGPRTYRGRQRVTLNALKHGRNCVPRFFRTRLLQNHEDVALFDWMYDQTLEHIKPTNPRHWKTCESTARLAFCRFLNSTKRYQRLILAGDAAVRAEQPATSSVWCSMRYPKRFREDGDSSPAPTTKRCQVRRLFPCKYQLRFEKTGHELTFWVCQRRRWWPAERPGVLARVLNWFRAKSKPRSRME